MYSIIARLRGRKSKSSEDVTSGKKKRRFPFRVRLPKFARKKKPQTQEQDGDLVNGDKRLSQHDEPWDIDVKDESDIEVGENGPVAVVEINVEGEPYISDSGDDFNVRRTHSNVSLKSSTSAFQQLEEQPRTPDQVSRLGSKYSLSQRSESSQRRSTASSTVGLKSIATQTDWLSGLSNSTPCILMSNEYDYSHTSLFHGQSETSVATSITTATGSSFHPLEEETSNPELVCVKERIRNCIVAPNLDNCSAEICISLLRCAKLPFLITLNNKLSEEDEEFNAEFIAGRGIETLLHQMDVLEVRGYPHFSDVVMILEVSECVTSLVNSPSCREFLLEHGEHIWSVARALETKNLMVKMQIFELLSALCVYSKDGYYLTLDALERYRSWQKLQYRMNLLVNELRKADLTTYRTTIMALINSLIVANENIRDRVRLRNEFVSLGIIEAIQVLRCDEDSDLKVQCDVFEEELNADEEALEGMKDGTVNLNDHQSVYKAIYSRVHGTPLESRFLGVLHSLFQIDPYNMHSESMWSLMERLLQEAVHSDPAKDGDRLVNQCRDQTVKTKDQEIQTEEVESPTSPATSSAPVPPPPPPPPPPPGSSVIPPPPPPPPPAPGSAPPPPPPPPPGAGPPPPPPPPGGGPPPPPPPPGAPPPPGGAPLVEAPQGIITPKPSVRMKTLTWNKIPVHTITKKQSVWEDVLKMKDDVPVEYERLEELFGQKTATSSSPLSPETKGTDPIMMRKNSKTTHEVTLLDSKKSMNLNIFLKQFRKSNEEIVELIRKGNPRDIGIEKLKGLTKNLPQPDELELIQGYDGDVEFLGNAEKFIHKLVGVDHYKLRIEAMMVKGDFNSQLGSIRPNIQVLTTVCRKLFDNPSLKIFLRYVLHAGNFINKGNSSGEALGFRISSLNKLAITKSSVPRMTLLHHLVEQVQAKHKEGLAFVEELLEPLQKSSRFTLEGVIGEFTSLKTNFQSVQRQLENAGDDIKDQFMGFFEEATTDITDVDEGLVRVQKLSSRLAQHYCENENSFKINEFLETFREFCEKVKGCQQDFIKWREDEERTEKRRKTREELAEKRRSGGNSPTYIPGQNEDRKIVDNIVNEIRRGKVLRRLSLKQKCPGVQAANQSTEM